MHQKASKTTFGTFLKLPFPTRLPSGNGTPLPTPRPFGAYSALTFLLRRSI